MKRFMKRIVPLVLIVVMCVCMAAPAFASTAQEIMDTFPKQYRGCSNGFCGLIQRYMSVYDQTARDYIVGSGGVDGKFGDGTRSAVLHFQDSVDGISSDAVFGAQSWPYLSDRISTGGSDSFTYYLYYSYYFKAWVNMMRISNVSNYQITSSSAWNYNKSTEKVSTTYGSLFVGTNPNA